MLKSASGQRPQQTAPARPCKWPKPVPREQPVSRRCLYIYAGSPAIQARVERSDAALENNTDYGLSAGVITNDMQKALDLAFGLESGMAHLNDCTVADGSHVPFGGVKNSGFGREGGRFSMEEMTEVKWITMQRGQRGFPM